MAPRYSRLTLSRITIGVASNASRIGAVIQVMDSARRAFGDGMAVSVDIALLSSYRGGVQRRRQGHEPRGSQVREQPPEPSRIGIVIADAALQAPGRDFSALPLVFQIMCDLGAQLVQISEELGLATD